ncbi:hypothetical protein BD770DRAFT_432337 [Pilaira anomala]|nr:hypothetical protein BD770DRAFT_432337 [Pilaira anomala]
MAGGVAMTGAAMTGVAMIGIALTNTGAALVVVVMMDKTVVVMTFQQCNGFVKAMIKFCEFYFLASMLYLDGSCLLLFRPRLRAVRAVQSWVESWIDGSHLGGCHLKGKYYDQRLIVATTPQQLVILFFGEYVLSCRRIIEAANRTPNQVDPEQLQSSLIVLIVMKASYQEQLSRNQ